MDDSQAGNTALISGMLESVSFTGRQRERKKIRLRQVDGVRKQGAYKLLIGHAMYVAHRGKKAAALAIQ